MENIMLNIELLSDNPIKNNNNVIFDNIIYITGNISYNNLNGIITINETGEYLVNWWITTQTSMSNTGACFAISSSQEDLIIGDSPIKTGHVTGTCIINVSSVPITISLINISSETFFYPNIMPVKAALTIIKNNVQELGPTGPTGASGLIGPTGPTGSTGPTGPNLDVVGFSATKTSVNVSSSTKFQQWSISDPYYGDINFDATEGNFTIINSGRYSIKATINYSTALAITASIGSSSPYFVVRRISPTTTDLLSGVFPILNINVLVLTLRAVLGNGTITLAGDVNLLAGDVIGLFYVANGLNLSINLGSSNSGGIVWSIHRMT